ncbi:DUF7666 domain-containing protein [Brevundimonas pondensis]|uniref:DUF7666 domain-containing protein n=1 Tax=Brevundimonas pondensis TaxID=2774189 RepID=A0ABX7SMN9_9CAUL|nr:hypothetical protein [Brevundimonas pondensis]QTC88067.1 hypothetical protein IFE19_01275 [Brevundimonas pondensis]
MAAKKKTAEATPVIRAIKAFDQNLKCRDFQFAIGETFTHVGTVKACEGGFHAITGHPLAVFGYYPPAGTRFCLVEQSGATDTDDGEKTASEILKVGQEIGLSALVQEAVKWVQERSTPEGETATGTRGAASSTGYQGAASSTGDYGAASSTGTRGAASSTGTRGAASSTGDYGAASSTGTRGAASSTGTRGAASSTGDQGAAMASGFEGRVMGADGNALFAIERETWNGPIVSIASGIVGQDGIKAGAWYQAKSGKLVEVQP